MRRTLLAALLGLAPIGCLGGTGNPSYFPYLLPPGDVVRTHGKPPGFGYFADFDPKAVKLDVTPTSKTAPTKTQQVLIATVLDKDGTPRRKRRVEWKIDGPGVIVEVDESGYTAGRGYTVDNKAAVSYTDFLRHTLTRGNDDPADDIELRPGQTWCVVSSAVEGRTTVTVYAPEVHNWDNGRAFVTLDWQDAPFAVNAGGTQTSSKEPRAKDLPAGARVTLDAALPSVVAVGRDVSATITLANGGRADSSPVTVSATIPDGCEYVSADPAPARRLGSELMWSLPAVPGGGSRPIAVVVRPTRKGPVVLKASATTDDNLQARTSARAEADTATLKVVADAAAAAAGGPVPVRVKVTNTTGVPIDGAVAWVDGVNSLTGGGEVPVGKLAAGETKTVTASLAAAKPGRFPVRVNVTADGGLTARTETTVVVATAELKIDVNGPASVGVGDEATYAVVLTNPGEFPLTNLIVKAALPAGLTAKSAGESGRIGNDGVTWAIDKLPPGGRTALAVVTRGARLGDGAVRVTASGSLADGGRVPEATASAQVSVSGSPALTLELATPSGPVSVGGRAVYRATVRNRGTAPARGVEVSFELSPELSAANGKAFGPLDLPAGESRSFTLDADAVRAGDARVTAAVRAKELPQPLREEQPTRVRERR